MGGELIMVMKIITDDDVIVANNPALILHAFSLTPHNTLS